MTKQAADLQSATIDYEAAKAAYEEATVAADDSALQGAGSSIQNAQVKLDDLVDSPSAAEIAAAEAQVASAEASLSDLQTGASANELRSAEITLQQALIDLETAHRNLAAATVTAPWPAWWWRWTPRRGCAAPRARSSPQWPTPHSWNLSSTWPRPTSRTSRWARRRRSRSTCARQDLCGRRGHHLRRSPAATPLR